MTASGVLPAALVALLDGTDLRSKIGQTVLLSAVSDDGWPHTALLSVGEVVAPDDRTLRIASYAGSRTTTALRQRGKGMLLAVVDGVVHKAWFAVTAAGQDAAGRLSVVDAVVERVEHDQVAYARVRHGIEFDLLDPDQVLGRWEQQVAELREGRV